MFRNGARYLLLCVEAELQRARPLRHPGGDGKRELSSACLTHVAASEPPRKEQGLTHGVGEGQAGMGGMDTVGARGELHAWG